LTTWSGFALEGGPPSSFTDPAALQGSDAIRCEKLVVTASVCTPVRCLGCRIKPLAVKSDMPRKTRTCHFSHDPKEKGFQLSDSRLDMDADQRVQKGYESCTIFGVWCEQSCRKYI